jgi:hypothetical protein
MKFRSFRIAVLIGFAAFATAAVTPYAGAQNSDANGIMLSATSHNYVSVPEGTIAKYGVHVANRTGADFPFDVTLTGSANFTQQNDCGKVLKDGRSCEIIFSYTAPTISEYDSAEFIVAMNGKPFPNGNKGILKAHSVPGDALTVNTFKHNFGGVQVSKSGDNFGLLVSNGTSSEVQIKATLEGSSDFHVVTDNCNGTIKAAMQCSVIIGFTPTHEGPQQATLELYTGGITVKGPDNLTGGTVTLVGMGEK